MIEITIGYLMELAQIDRDNTKDFFSLIFYIFLIYIKFFVWIIFKAMFCIDQQHFLHPTPDNIFGPFKLHSQG